MKYIYSLKVCGEDYGECYMGDCVKITGLPRSTLKPRAQDHRIIDGIEIEILRKDTDGPIVRKEIPKEPVVEIPKEEIEYQSIVRILKEYGNTNLVKKELNHLTRLQNEMNIKVEHYSPRKMRTLCEKDNVSSKEDWIITWLDFGEEKEKCVLTNEIVTNNVQDVTNTIA